MKPILDGFRAQWGDAEFGYRVQAIFAHVLLRLGAKVIEVNAQGHPDVRAELGARTFVVQVKTASHHGPYYQLQVNREELLGIKSVGDCRGYLAVLDCAVPVGWLMLSDGHAADFVERPARIATIRALCENPLSLECTDVFLDLIIAEQHRLPHLSFRLLADRALRGEPL